MKMTKKWNDGTANFWEGCTKVSIGCEFCKGAARDEKHRDGKHWGEGAERSRLKSGFALANSFQRAAADGRFREDLLTGERKIWKRAEMKTEGTAFFNSRPVRPQLHVMDLGDFFDEETPTEIRMMALETMMSCPDVDFLILTKRPHLVRKLIWEVCLLAGDLCRDELVDWLTDWLAVGEKSSPPKNIFLGVTVELQDQTDRFEELTSQIESAGYFVAMQPLLGAITIPADWQDRVKLLVVSGSAGPDSRPIHSGWIEDIVTASGLYRIPLHFAGWGDWIPEGVDFPPVELQKRDTLLQVAPSGAVSPIDQAASEGSELTCRYDSRQARTLPDGMTADARIVPIPSFL